ncbi:MAG: DUF63 family protein [archaeon]
MKDVLERVGLERAWGALVGGIVTILALGSILFPRAVYVEFVWHYFWGPVYADAKGASCTAWDGGAQPVFSSGECQTLTDGSSIGPIAEPGYTIVSEVGYAALLIVMLVGVGLLLRRLRIKRFRALFFALTPFMFLGGAMRVLEDANNRAIDVGAEQTIAYPWNTLLISPLIYFTVFFLALGALVLAIRLDRTGRFEGFEYPLAGIGTAVLALTLSILAYLALAEDYVSFHPLILAVNLVGAVVVTAVTWYAIARFAPELNAGTEAMGIPIIFGQAIDGVANVVGLDWASELGLGYDLVPKHPVNAFVVDVTSSVLPASVVQVTGDAWPFLIIKMVAAVFVIWIFDEAVYEESPRFTIMLLIAVVAVGLGPGTRDMLRATFGV